jgi:hypothetical protein
MSDWLHTPATFTIKERALDTHRKGGRVAPETLLNTVVQGRILSFYWVLNLEHLVLACSLITISLILYLLLHTLQD